MRIFSTRVNLIYYLPCHGMMDTSDVKFEDTKQLVCCVCDGRKSCISPVLVYFCSNNCEKLFLLVQGLVVGNVLHSLFGHFSEFSYYENKHEQFPKFGNNYTNSIRQSQVHCSFGNQISEDSCSDMLENKTLPPDLTSQLTVDIINSSEINNSDNTSNGSFTFDPIVLKSVKRRTCLGTKSKHFKMVHKKIEGCFGVQAFSCQRNLSRCDFNNHSTFSKMPVSVMSSIKGSVLSIDISDKQIAKETQLRGCVTEGRNINDTKIEKRRVKCKRCSKMVNRSYLYVHYRAVHKDHLSDISESSVSCSECGKMFMRNQALNAHKLKRHNHKFTNHCNHCGKGFASLFGLSWHMRQVHKVTVRQCGDCGETFENRCEYKKHRRYRHTVNSHVCHICGKGFKLKNALQAHLDAHAGVKLHFCEICGDGFVRFSSLCQHRNNLHGPKKSDLPFKCHLCPNTFRLKAWLDKHIFQKHKSAEGTNEDCELCQTSAKTAVRCSVHTGGLIRETFSCPQCDKAFAKDTNLKVHMKQHQEPKFSCDICHKKFTYKCNMMRHRDTHSTEKPFNCETCAKQFCTKFLLASHMRMHNEDLMFKCEICGKGLTRKDYLKNHFKKMHPNHTLTNS